MSVIYKALKTIEAAEGAQPDYSSTSGYTGNESADRRGEPAGRGRLGVLVGAVGLFLAALLGAITLLTKPHDREAAVGTPVAREFAVDLTGYRSPIVVAALRDAERRAGNAQPEGWRNKAAGDALEQKEAAIALSPKKLKSKAAPGVHVDEKISAITVPTVKKGIAQRVVWARPARDVVTVTADHNQRVRILNARLGEAVRVRDAAAADRILGEMKSLVGNDSAYMLKVRAFAQLALGRDINGAATLLQEVLARNPDDRDAALNMAVAELRLGKRDQARDRLEALAIDHPGDRQIDELLRSIH